MMKTFDRALEDAFVAGFRAREEGKAPGPAYGEFREGLSDPDPTRGTE